MAWMDDNNEDEDEDEKETNDDARLLLTGETIREGIRLLIILRTWIAEIRISHEVPKTSENLMVMVTAT